MWTLKFMEQWLKKAGSIGIRPGKAVVENRIDSINRSDPTRNAINAVKVIYDRLLVRHGHVATAPIRIIALKSQIIAQVCGVNFSRRVVRFYPQLLQPESVDQWGFGLGDRGAN